MSPVAHVRTVPSIQCVSHTANDDSCEQQLFVASLSTPLPTQLLFLFPYSTCGDCRSRSSALPANTSFLLPSLRLIMANSSGNVSFLLVCSVVFSVIGISILGTRVDSDIEAFNNLLPTVCTLLSVSPVHQFCTVTLCDEDHCRDATHFPTCEVLESLYGEEYNASSCFQSSDACPVQDAVCDNGYWCCDEGGYSCYDSTDHLGCKLHWYFCAEVDYQVSYQTEQGDTINSSVTRTFDTFAEASDYDTRHGLEPGNDVRCWYNADSLTVVRFNSYGFNIASWVFGWFFMVLGCWFIASASSLCMWNTYAHWTFGAVCAVQLTLWVGLVLPLAILLPLYLTIRIDNTTGKIAWLIVILHLAAIGAYSCLHLILVRPNGSMRVNERRAKGVKWWFLLVCYPCWLLPLHKQIAGGTQRGDSVAVVLLTIVPLFGALSILLCRCPTWTTLPPSVQYEPNPRFSRPSQPSTPAARMPAADIELLSSTRTFSYPVAAPAFYVPTSQLSSHSLAPAGSAPVATSPTSLSPASSANRRGDYWLPSYNPHASAPGASNSVHMLESQHDKRQH